MNMLLSGIIRKIFVGSYVSAGVIRHYFSKMSIKAAILILALVCVIATTVVYFLPNYKTIPGNEALNAAYDLQNRGRHHAAHAEFEKAYEIFSEERYTRGMYLSLLNLGETDMVLGDLGEALYHYDAALRLAQQMGNKDGQIYLLKKHANIKLRQSRVDAARAHLYDAVQIAREDGNDAAAGSLFTSVGNLERDIGNSRRARYSYRSAKEHFETSRSQLGLAYLYFNLGILEGNLDNYDDAIASYQTSREFFKSENETAQEAETLYAMATLEKKRGHLKSATDYYNEAIILYGSVRKTDRVEKIREEAGPLIM